MPNIILIYFTLLSRLLSSLNTSLAFISPLTALYTIKLLMYHRSTLFQRVLTWCVQHFVLTNHINFNPRLSEHLNEILLYFRIFLSPKLLDIKFEKQVWRVFALLCEVYVCLCGSTYLLFIWEFSGLPTPPVGADKSELWKNNSSPTTYWLRPQTGK